MSPQPEAAPVGAAPPASGLDFSVLGVGLVGPGLPSWAQVAEAWRAGQAHVGAPTVLPAPQRLPANERRRASPIVKASLAAADEALASSGLGAAALPTIFTASGADGGNCHALCEALAGDDRLISPTRFTNSVHNASAGYWHIATQSMAPSTSLCGFDASFGAGLLEALVQVQALGAPVLLVAGDAPYPEPLNAKRPLPDVMALALVLAPAGSPGAITAASRLALAPGVEPDRFEDPALEALRLALPVARALPWLRKIARNEGGEIALDYLPGLAFAVSMAPETRGGAS